MPLIVAAIIIIMALEGSFTAVRTISSVVLLSKETSFEASRNYAFLKNTNNISKPRCCVLCLSLKWPYSAACWKGFFGHEHLPRVCGCPVLQLPGDNPRPLVQAVSDHVRLLRSQRYNMIFAHSLSLEQEIVQWGSLHTCIIYMNDTFTCVTCI